MKVKSRWKENGYPTLQYIRQKKFVNILIYYLKNTH